MPDETGYYYDVDATASNHEHFTKYLKKHSNRPIIIYVHGNAQNRFEFQCVHALQMFF